jgi:multisubunit Na+/H+ antiporter MnhE subunit
LLQYSFFWVTFPFIWILLSDVSEHSVYSIFLGRVVTIVVFVRINDNLIKFSHVYLSHDSSAWGTITETAQ